MSALHMNTDVRTW